MRRTPCAPAISIWRSPNGDLRLQLPSAADGAHPRPPPARGKSDGDARSTRSPGVRDRKSTRLNSSHITISYAVFCLKKKKKKNKKKKTKKQKKKKKKNTKQKKQK